MRALFPFLVLALPGLAFAQEAPPAGEPTPNTGRDLSKIDPASDAGAPTTQKTTLPAGPLPAAVQPTPADVAGTVKIETGAAGTLNPGTTPAQDGSGYDPLGSAGARAVGMAPPGTRASDFMDTRLSWTFGDDDFLHRTGELLPFSPTFSIAERPQYRLFFDNLNSRFTGRENLTHLVMYKKMPGFLPRLDTEAAIVLRLDFAALAGGTGNLNSALYDSGSYIRLFYNTGASSKEGLSAVFFPLDTDRFRLGYLYDISWGGTAASINQSIFPRIQGSSPGLKVQFDSKRFYAFAGFKTATIIQPEQVLKPGGESEVEAVRVGETNYGVLGGLGVDLLDSLRFDAGAGYFMQGKFDLEDVRGKSVYTYGASGRVVFHHKMPVPQSVDFKLYRNDPLSPMIIFAPEKYDPGELAWSISAEGAALFQHLKDFDTAGGVKDQPAYAGAIQGVVKAGYARVSATGIYRNLNFVERNVPGFIPFETLPRSAQTDPELFGALAADYHIASLRLTPGIGGGVQLPATFRSDFTEGGGSIPASRTIVVRQQGDVSLLPYNEERSLIFQSRLTLRWDISTILSAVLWGQYVRDNNATLVVRDPSEGTASLRVFQSPDRLGVGTMLQARF